MFEVWPRTVRRVEQRLDDAVAVDDSSSPLRELGELGGELADVGFVRFVREEHELGLGAVEVASEIAWACFAQARRVGPVEAAVVGVARDEGGGEGHVKGDAPVVLLAGLGALGHGLGFCGQEAGAALALPCLAAEAVGRIGRALFLLRSVGGAPHVIDHAGDGGVAVCRLGNATLFDVGAADVQREETLVCQAHGLLGAGGRQAHQARRGIRLLVLTQLGHQGGRSLIPVQVTQSQGPHVRQRSGGCCRVV